MRWVENTRLMSVSTQKAIRQSQAPTMEFQAVSLGNKQLNKTTDMKKYTFLTLIAGVALCFTSCTDELDQFTTKHTGDEIIFGARASYELNETGTEKAPATRTIYTGEFLGADGKAWQSGTKYEGVHWIKGDQVRIYCPQASGSKTADYTVTESDEGISTGDEVKSNHQTSLVKNSNYAAALQWGNPNTTHDFYAVYPAPSQYNSAVADDVLNNATQFVGEIPSVQPHRGKAYIDETTTVTCNVAAKDENTPATTITGTNKITSPNMKYAYMVAKRSLVPNQTTDEVYLSFTPIATAVEITIQNVAANNQFPNGQTLYLTNVLVSSTNNTAICGQFDADLSKINEDGSAISEDDSPFTLGTTTGTQITVPMYDDGLYGNPIQLAYGQAITFTVFMLPTVDLNSLQVVVQGLGGTKSGTITGVNIKKQKKTYLTNVPFAGKNVLPFTQSEWLKYVEDDVVLNALSIPGAGGAASGHATNWDTNKKYLQQSVTINELWDYGVRCFEFTVDRSATPTDGTIPDIGANNVYCNGKDCGVTLANAVKLVKEALIAHPQEFAMIILTYQENEGWGQARDAEAWMTQINSFWGKVRGGTHTVVGTWPAKADTEDIQTGTALYSHSATMLSARGKLFCIARPTSEYEDNPPTITYEYIEPTYNGLFDSQDNWSECLAHNNLKHIDGITYPGTLSVTTVDQDILVIQGWGAMKDKFERRGFTTCVFHRGTGHTNYSELKNYLSAVGSTTAYNEIGYIEGAVGRPFDVASSASAINTITDTYISSNMSNLSPNFDYAVQTSSGTTANGAWVQEWARVSNISGAFDGTDNDGNSKGFYWANSYAEKVQRVKDCLSAAIASTDNKIYINSLCGYFIDKTEPNSYYPNSLSELNGQKASISSCYVYSELTGQSATAGMSGDIATFASTINSEFYTHLQTVTSGFVPGSMGIILMDRVDEGKGAEVPGIIVANNFQHKTSASALSLPRADLEEGDEIAAPKRRSASEESDEMKIVWE